MKKIISLALALILMFTLVTPALAEDNKGTTVRLGDTTGTVTVKNASNKAQSSRKDMRLYNGYSVQTGTKSSAYITLDDTKAIKLDSSTKVEVKKSGKQLEVKLVSGNLYFSVTQPLSSDESLNICTSTMVTGIRGSSGWVKPNEMGLLHGHVTVTCRNPYTGEVRVTEVTSGQRVYFDPDAEGANAEPRLLEIDFVKELMRNEDVPRIAIEELREDAQLQEDIDSDVDNLDVPTLLGLEEGKRAEEDEENEKKQQEIDEAMAEQDKEITGADQVFTPAPPAPPAPSVYTVTLPTDANYAITNVTGGTMVDATHYSVTSGGSFGFTVEPAASYAVYEDYLAVSAGTASVTVTQNGTDCDVSFTVTGDRTVSVDSGVYYEVTNETDLMDQLSANTPEIVFNAATPVTFTGTQTINNDQTVLLKSNVTVPGGQSLTISSVGTGTAAGKLIIDSGVTLATDPTTGGTIDNQGVIEGAGGLDIESGGTLTSNGTITLDGAMRVDGGTFTNAAGRTVTLNGTSYFNGMTALTNNGTVIFNGAVTTNAYLNNNSGGVITLNADMNNTSAITNIGTFTVSAGHTLSVSANINNNGGSLKVDGMLALTGVIYNSSDSSGGNIEVNGEIAMSGGSASINHTGTLASITVATVSVTVDSTSGYNYGSTLTGTGSITGTGTIYCTP